jgi:long-chain acyl-CoA synthetase
MEKRTIARLWRDAVAQGRSGPAYLVERGDGWQEVSWTDAAERVERIANGLLARGIRKGDAFAILARTTLEWSLLDFALAQVGAIGTGIYPISSAKDVHYVLEHSESVGVLCEDEEQHAKVESVSGRLPALRHVLVYDDLPALEAEGEAYRASHPEALAEATAAIEEDDLFTFIYTSGTTGPPKACMISNRNYYAMASCMDDVERFVDESDVMLLYLPLAHNFGRLMQLSGAYVGFTVAHLPDPLRVAEALTAVRPTVFPSVPRVYEKMHSAILSALEETTGVKRRLADWALAVGRRAGALRAAGAEPSRSLRAQLAVADRLVHAKIRARLGGRLRTPISGGAPLAKEIAEFFDAVGVRILEGYGLTECTTAATTNRPDRYRFGTVGVALPGFELRTDEDGELLIRSETVFQGYYKDPEATAAVLTDDGWLRSGDIAEIDGAGFVTITDRKKDIIITAGGKNVAPQNLENDLKGSRYVSQALVIGDRRPYLTALITLDPTEIEKWAAEEGLTVEVAAVARDPRVRALVQEIVDGVNADRSRFEQLKRFAILPRDFTMADGELTPTLKLRRRVVLDHFGDEVEELYAAGPDGPIPLEAQEQPA